MSRAVRAAVAIPRLVRALPLRRTPRYEPVLASPMCRLLLIRLPKARSRFLVAVRAMAGERRQRRTLSALMPLVTPPRNVAVVVPVSHAPAAMTAQALPVSLRNNRSSPHTSEGEYIDMGGAGLLECAGGR